MCRLAKKVEEMARVQKNLDAQLKEYRDMKRLEADNGTSTSLADS